MKLISNLNLHQWKEPFALLCLSQDYDTHHFNNGKLKNTVQAKFELFPIINANLLDLYTDPITIVLCNMKDRLLP